jgi:putative ABC transport system permease protein
MPAPRDPLVLRLCLGIVRLVGALVPRASRRAWRDEWESEFRHRHQVLAAHGRIDWSHNMDLLRRALGALPDAAWIRRQFTADSEVFHDVRHALRMLRKTPSFTLAAVSILAVGIGGTVAIATLVDTLWFRSLPYAHAERIVTLWQRPAAGGREDVAPANFIDWRERSRSFEALAAIIPYSHDFTGSGEPEVAFGAQVTEGFFDVMGTPVLLGRAFRPEEHAAGAPRVVMITHGLWHRRFGGDPAIVDRPINLDGEPFTVVGVLPPDFRPQLLPRPGELTVWTPKVIQEHERRTRGSAWWNVVGRLKPGVSLEDAQAEMTAIATTLGREYARTNANVGAEVVSLREHLMGDVRLPLLVLFGAVAVVLAIACANVANLLLARGMGRERELAIRAALGAGRLRILRQLVVESLLLSMLAAALGVVLAWWLIGAIVSLAPAGVLRLQDASLDGRILLFAAVLTTVTAVAFGLIPAIQFSKPARDVMRERQSRPPRAGLRRILVTAEVALAVVLLTSAGLLIRSFERLLSVDPGFSPKHTVALQVFAYDRNPTLEKRLAFFRSTLERLSTLPGVEAAGAVSAMPFANANIDIRSPLTIVGRAPKAEGEEPGVHVTIATPGYFRALSVPLREGRLLGAQDTSGAPPVAVISESLRRRHWGDRSPIGERIQVQWQGRPLEIQVVGVVTQIRHEGLDSAPREEVFLPLEQVPFGSMTYVLKGSGDAAALIASARQAVWSVDPLQTFYDTGRVDQWVDTSVVRQRFSMTLLSSFAAMALALCAIGIYGVISFATAQRTREIGVRMALGADHAAIRGLVLREGSALVMVGILCGLAGSLAVTRYLQRLLFEVRAVDPLTIGAACGILGGVALVACYVPARRAMRVDPVVALRVE